MQIFVNFKRLANLCKNSSNKKEILSFCLAGTKHSDLLAYHTDKGISIATKLAKYKQTLETFSPSTKKEEDQPSSVFGYSETKKGSEYGKEDKQLPTAYQIAQYNAIQEKSNALAKELEEFKKLGYEKEHLIKQLLKDKEELEKQQPKIIEVKYGDTLKGSLQGERFHKQLPLIVKLLASRNAMSYTEFLYIWGAPGSGKTHMSKQIAKCLGVPCFTYPVGPTITEGKLLGFNNIATGSFIAGWLYKAYRDGGLVALDEIDLADAAVLGATNSIENSEYIFGNGEYLERHKDFYLIAFANTQGTGSTKGFTRNILDAATRDRFTQIKLEYDEELEQQIYGNIKWAKYVQKVRDYIEKTANSSVYITPRATRKGAAYLASGIDPSIVCDITIFKSCNKDMKEGIIANVGKFTL